MEIDKPNRDSPLGEFDLIERIIKKFSKSNKLNPRLKPGRSYELLLCGPGDDAAAFSHPGNKLILITTDLLIENVHFDLKYQPPSLLGRKALSINLSDIAAMGGEASYFTYSMGIPSHTNTHFLDSLIQGLFDVSEEYNLTLIGGDTSRSSILTISISIIGEVEPQRMIKRKGAVINHGIYVTGTLGDSRLGLNLLKSKRNGPKNLSEEEGDFLIERHLNPRPRLKEGKILAEKGYITSMIDISDGLMADLRHICNASGVGARIYLKSLPLSTAYRKTVARNKDFFKPALSGGEDYELLFSSPLDRSEEIESHLSPLGCKVTCIGTIEKGPGIEIIDQKGKPYTIEKEGWRHF